MNERRIVVTGIGALTPVGNDVDTFWKSVVEGVSGIDKIKRFNPEELKIPTHIGGEVKNFDESDIMTDKKMLRRIDPFIKFALKATKEALDMASISKDDIAKDPLNYGVITGSGVGGLDTIYREQNNMFEYGARKVSPFLIPMEITNMSAGVISMEFGFKGPNYSISSACASASHAIADAYMTIKSGLIDVCITGGAECAIVPVGYAGFCSLRAMSTRNDEPTRASRPFDVDRDGFVMGEGAGTLIIEELEHAKKRGANILAEIVGFGSTADAYHLTAPDEEGAGAISAMKMALKMAKINPEDIDYINTHGTSTPAGDKCETKAIKRAFGDHAYKLKINSTKSLIGHLLGAAGAVEGIVCIKSILDGKLHPTINIDNQDPECDLDYVPNEAQDCDVKYVLSNSFGFGGHNACLIFKNFE